MSAGRRTVKVEILGDAKSIASAFGSAGNAAGGFASKIGGIAKGAGMALAGIGVAAGAMAISGINAASDFEEALNKVRVVFGDSSQSVEDFAKNAAQAFGLSESSALAATGTFGNLFTSMGLGQKEAAGLSTDVLGLAADLGSFNNLGTEEVLEKIRAGLVGETEPLKSLGINLNAAAIEAKAMEMGLADATGALSPAAKAQAAYALIVEQTTNAQGDFARTKDGMANSLKVIKASFQDVQVQIGQKLLPVITPLIVAFAARLPGAIDIAMGFVERVAGVLKGPLSTAFRLIRDGVLTFVQALSGNWTDNENIQGLHRVFGNLGLIIREQVIPAIVQIAGFFQETLWPVIQSGLGVIQGLVAAFSEGGIGGALAALPGLIGPHLEMVGELLLGLGQKLVDWVAPMIPPLLEKLGELALSIGDWIVNTGLPLLAEQLGVWADAFGAWAADAVPPLLEQLAGLLEVVGAWIADEGLPLLFEKLQAWGQALIDWIGPRIVPVLTALGELLLAIGEWVLTTALPEIAAKLLEWGAQFVAWVQPQIPPLLSKLGELLSSLGSWLIDTALPEIGAKLLEWGLAFVAWISPQIPPLLLELGKLLLDVGTWLITTALPEIVTKLGEWGLAFLGWIAKDVLPFLAEKLAAILTDVGAWILDTGVPGMIDLAKDLGGAVIDGIKAGIDAAWEVLTGALDGVISFVKGKINDAIGVVNGGINAINGALEFTIPGWDPPGPGPKIPSLTVNPPDIPLIPELARGGIVPARQGGRLVTVSEAGYAEAIIPLDSPQGKRALASGGMGNDDFLNRLEKLLAQHAGRVERAVERGSNRALRGAI